MRLVNRSGCQSAAFLVTAVVLLCPSLAIAQVDLAGRWSATSQEDRVHRVPGPELGDYTGIAVNEAARVKARTWDASILSQPEQQARPHPAQYSLRGPANLRIDAILDPLTYDVVAYRIIGLFGNADRTIWMDGRPHPSARALHTWGGFSTGEWTGQTLKVTTTHMKAAFIQRNGVPASAHSRMTEYFVRHDDLLLNLSIIEDPIYLEEPFVRTTTFAWNPRGEIAPPSVLEIVDEVAGRPVGYVPHFPIGTLHTEFAERNGLPYEATQGGRHTLYPEYGRELQVMMAQPSVTLGARGTVEETRAPEAAVSRPVEGSPGIEVLPVRGGVHLIGGAGGNVVAQVSDQGVLLVDSGNAANVDEVLAAVALLSDRPIRYLINTSDDLDHTGGNESLAQAGANETGNAPGNFRPVVAHAPIVAHEAAYRRMSAATGQQASRPFGAWPTSTFFGAKKTMWFGGDGIELLAQPAAHTDGDLIVYFRQTDIIAAGDVFVTENYPVIDLARGGSVQGLIDAANRIIDIAIPRFNQQGGTLVIPGHGRISNEADVVEYRDMLTIVRDRVQRMIDEGSTLEQVIAARPTFDYDGVYGASTGPWTTSMFVEVVYRSLLP